MAFLEVRNIRVAGMSAGVPQKVVCNLDIENVSKDYDAASFVEVTGVKERHFDELTVSDLSVPAANRLIDDLGWQKSDIDGLIVVTQHGDYIVPATSYIIQASHERLSRSLQRLSVGCSSTITPKSVCCGR